MAKDKILEQLETGKVGNEQQLSDLEQNIAMHEEALSLGDEVLRIEEEINKIAVAKPRILEATHEFHNDDSYWELESELRTVKFAQKKMGLLDQRKNLVRSIEEKKKEYERMKGE